MATDSLRLYSKVLLLLEDLVTNDDTIFKSRPFAVRDHCLGSETIMQQLIAAVSDKEYVGDL